MLWVDKLMGAFDEIFQVTLHLYEVLDVIVYVYDDSTDNIRQFVRTDDFLAFASDKDIIGFVPDEYCYYLTSWGRTDRWLAERLEYIGECGDPKDAHIFYSDFNGLYPTVNRLFKDWMYTFDPRVDSNTNRPLFTVTQFLRHGLKYNPTHHVMLSDDNKYFYIHAWDGEHGIWMKYEILSRDVLGLFAKFKMSGGFSLEKLDDYPNGMDISVEQYKGK